MKVAVIGAAGHVGFPFALVLAESGHQVFGVDTNIAMNGRIMQGEIPYLEEGAEALVKQALASGRLTMTDEVDVIAQCEAITIVIGTPIDENLKPGMDHLVELFRAAKPWLKNQLVVLRSTVSPGTTDAIRRLIGSDDGSGLTLVFGPERVLQGKAISEIKRLPQLIGAYSAEAYERAASFFRTFIQGETFFLSPVEAELGKLITNMARYVEFALANEFHLICESFGANACRVIDACNKDYPRLKMPVPGPNVGGPCLQKDGWFMVDKLPFQDLIASAFNINESMTMHILESLDRKIAGQKVAILGMTFKANCDDTRNSLSFKLRRQVQSRGYEAICVDPYVADMAPLREIAGAGAVVLMTPHTEFADLREIVQTVDNPDCWMVDLWGFWPDMRHRSRNGYFQAKEC